MKIKEEKGFTAVDVSIAIIIIFIFTSILAVLFFQYNNSSQELERKSQATYYAIAEIEKIKNSDFENYIGQGVSNIETVEEGNVQIQNESGITEDTEYYKTITVEDYAYSRTGKKQDLVKTFKVTISYKFNNKTQSVELSTVKTKGN
mgnify:CR=1 FL=1